MSGRVFDIQRFSLHDGPGIRTTVFMKGCSLRCFWCQNPEGLSAWPELLYTAAFCAGCRACVKACPNGAHHFVEGHHEIDRRACTACGACVAACLAGALRVAGQEMDVADVVAAVREDEPYYQRSGGGVTLSGGEPLCQAEFAGRILVGCRAAGIHTALDTSLDGDWTAVRSLLPHVDLLLIDLKTRDDDAHRRATGTGNERILANYRRLGDCDVPIEVRVPIIPGLNDTVEAIGVVAELAATNRNLRRIELLPHHRLGETKREALGLPPVGRVEQVSPQTLRRLAEAAGRAGVEARCAGMPADSARERVAAIGSSGGGGSSAWTYDRRLDAIRRRKLEHAASKRQAGPKDVDDWGLIPLDGIEFHFTPETDHPKGYVLGPRDCGRNFRRFLAACPTYVDPASSLLGGYYVTFSGYVTGWEPEAFWRHLAGEIGTYGIIDGIDNVQHFLPDVRIGLELGFGGLLEKIGKYRAIHTDDDPQAFYDGLEAFVRGVQEWIANHVHAARALADDEPDGDVRQNLLVMAEMNARLVESPPETFREALQWLAWYQMAKRCYIGGGSMGSLDQVLLPHYRRDLAAGRLDEEEAIFDLACFLVKDSHYIQLGGIEADGSDASNELSLLFLEAAHRVRIPANLAVAVHERMDPRLMRRAVELLFVDKMGTPRFSGVEGVVDGLVRAGWPIEDARQRVQAGCHWFCLPGREYCFNDVIKVNFAKVIEVSVDEMMTDAENPPSLERLWRIFDAHLSRAVNVVAEGIDYHMAHQRRFYPELALSLLCHGPIEKGLDASAGSLEYTYIGVDGAALATAADSFAAIEQRIEAEAVVTWNELYCGLKQNWWRTGAVRRSMLSVPGFGRGGTPGDAWARRISRRFSELVVARPTPDGHRMCPGLFSWASVLSMGRRTGATPDGRHTGEPISFGANPNPERTRGGSLVPTALSTAVAQVQPGYGNPAPLQLDVDPGLVAAADGVAQFEALLRTHFALGGTLINANVLDRQRMLEACEHPNRHPDLVVRVTGFSAYFASLSDAFRKLVYDRIVTMEEQEVQA